MAHDRRIECFDRIRNTKCLNREGEKKYAENKNYTTTGAHLNSLYPGDFYPNTRENR